MTTSELLSPAGSLKGMHFAFAYGADAVYAGQPKYSLRVRNNEFRKQDNLAAGIAEAHRLGKKFYVASNLAPHNNKVRTFIKDMASVVEAKPDAVILSDPGLIMMVRERWPELTVHLSVQANAVNFATVKFWQRQGVQRVILSRELSLDEIEEIRQQCPDIELEVFVHGALCVAYSGRCLLSGYMTHRDSNQGACTNSCRWNYQAHPAVEDSSGDLVATPDSLTIDTPAMLLQEEKRPGEYMPAFEDEHGTYIMNSKDLRAVQHVGRLIELGIESLKIEGRTKSHYYIARTAQVYRRAIDDALAGRTFDMSMMDQLDSLANRGYTEGFYRRHPPHEFQNYEHGFSRGLKQQYVGDVNKDDTHPGMLAIDVKNRFQVGDELELMTPNGNLSLHLTHLEDEQGQSIKLAPGSGYKVFMPQPTDFQSTSDAEFSMVLRNLETQE